MPESLIEVAKRQAVENTLDRISVIIESNKNPDLVKGILFYTDREGRAFVSGNMPHFFGTDQNEIEEVILFLERNGIVKLSDRELSFHGDEFENIRLVGGIAEYLYSDRPFGPREYPQRDELTKEEILNVMNGLSDVVRFSYRKSFKFPPDKLNELGKRVKDGIGRIKTKEERFFYEILGVPKAFTGFPSFIKFDDITSDQGYTRDRFELHTLGGMISPEQALSYDFDQAIGVPIFVDDYNIKNKSDAYSPILEITTSYEEYKMKLNNIVYPIAKFGPFALIQDAKIFMPEIKSRLETMLKI